MIDKVKLTYWDRTAYKITDPGRFSSPIHSIGSHWHIYNSDRTKKATTYYPFVVLKRYPTKGSSYIQQVLEIDVSLPKILFGNNLYELQNKDWNDVCKALSNKLAQMGITITPTDIGSGTVKYVEYGKNLFTGRIPVSYILEELHRAQPLSGYMDVQQVSYRNGGEGLHFYCNSYEVVFYDKPLEIRPALNLPYCNIPARLKKELFNKKHNILRMEVRFLDRSVLLDFLKNNNFANKSGTLQDIYSERLSKCALTHYWQRLSQSARQNSPFVFSPAFELWKIHQGAGKQLSTQQSLAKLGARHLLREHGYKGARNALKRIGCTNPGQVLHDYVSRVFKPFWKLDIWRFLDRSLKHFVCLGPSKWQKLKIRSDGPWFKQTEPLIKLAEASKWLNVSLKTLRQEIKALRLAACKIGRAYQIHRYNLLEYMNA